jgi:hypothetical protein
MKRKWIGLFSRLEEKIVYCVTGSEFLYSGMDASDGPLGCFWLLEDSGHDSISLLISWL